MVPFAEGRITRLRRELKLLLPADAAERLARRLEEEATPHATSVAAVYFDTPDGRLARRAATTPGECTKVRAKAYDPDRGPAPGRAVLEVKRERDGTVLKDRLWVPRADVRAALASFAPPSLGALAPVVATSYARRVFQPSPAWRVTLDDRVAFHPASWDLVAAPSWHAALCPPFAADPRTVVELKFVEGRLPAWLAAIAAAAAVPFSKFAQAMAHAGRESSRGA